MFGKKKKKTGALVGLLVGKQSGAPELVRRLQRLLVGCCGCMFLHYSLELECCACMDRSVGFMVDG
jgi:hypothetical protein